MTAERTATETLDAARRLSELATAAAESAVAAASRLTEGGRLIDEHQVHSERIAQLTTEARAAEELLSYARNQAEASKPDALGEDEALAFSAEAVSKARFAVDLHPELFALDHGVLERLHNPETARLVREGLSDSHVRDIGSRVIDARGAFTAELEDPVAQLTRDTARSFTRTEVVPLAQEMHRQDLLVPESLIEKMAGLGLFGCSVPESYGGTEMGYLTMVVLTEELSSASLVAGSLITRSEILTKALLQGGTEEQRQYWLPRIASGEMLVGIAVTEH